MAIKKLADRMLQNLPAPTAGSKKTNATITYDSEVSGLGVRTTIAGAQSFILEYRTRTGRKRRYTIGRATEWSVGAARAEAKELKKLIAVGKDPMGEVRADREAPTVGAMCVRFEEEHLPKRRASTQRNYKALIANYILPKMKHLKVAEVTFSDVDGLHRKVTRDGSPYQANRTVATLSKMFNLAIKWQWRTDNPAKGIERNHEDKRERYLSSEELARLSDALADSEDEQGSNIIRLLLLTGARVGEVKAMRWDQLNLKEGTWTKAAAFTKQEKKHHVPLSPPALKLLAGLARKADDDAVFVFPGIRGQHRKEHKKAWAALRKAAYLSDARVHDLRHTYASVLVSSGETLPIIGRLLGHTQAQTTARYAHLQTDPLQKATDRAGAIIMGNGKRKSGNVVPMKRGRR